MTTAPTAATGSTSRRRDESGMSTARLALTVLASVLALACVGIVAAKAFAPGVLPSSWTAAQDAEDRQADVTTAARKVTNAFLDVDYRDMDPRTAKVLALSTGTFKKQYQKSQVELTAAARQNQAVSTGKVRNVGIGDIDEDSAVVFVAADSTVTNKAVTAAKAKGQKVDDQRYYRFQLNLTKVGDQWLLNNLEFVS